LAGIAMKISALWLSSLLLSSTCLAQSQQTRPALPDGGISQRLISIFIPNLPNAPFTATVSTEWVRILPDNTRLTLVNHRLIARDSAGRIFQERRRLVPPNGQQQSFITQTEIRDPVIKQQYICIPNAHTCQVEYSRPMASPVPPPSLSPAPNAAAGLSANQPEIQSLGTQTVAGVETIGTRETFTIPAGQIGNDSAIVTSREFWFSAQLGLDMVSVRSDPRFGTQRFELSDVILGEPDAKLFSPPEGSRIIDLRNQPVSKPATPQN
jgi:hypothetical protein